MATNTVLLSPNYATDAEFRTIGLLVSNIMSSGGWVKTAATGQIDWTTVLKPSATSQIRGFEMWSSNDAAGSLGNIYLKIEYGSSQFDSSWFGIRFTAGFSTDGSANLTGFVTTTFTSTNGGGGATAFPCNLSVGSGFVSLMLFNTGTNQARYFSLERTLNTSLAEQDEILVVYGSNTFTLNSQIVNKVTGAYPVEASPSGQGIINSVNAVQSGNAGFSLQFGCKAGLSNPSRNVYGSFGSVLGSAQSIISITSYGSTRNYIINAAAPAFCSSPQIQQIISRYE